jgi:hypothetical protein
MDGIVLEILSQVHAPVYKQVSVIGGVRSAERKFLKEIFKEIEKNGREGVWQIGKKIRKPLHRRLNSCKSSSLIMRIVFIPTL